MPNINLTDVLHLLPADAREKIIGDTFSRETSGCRLANRELRELQDLTVTSAKLAISRGTSQRWTAELGRAPPLDRFPRCASLSLRLAQGFDRLAGLALAGVSAEARQRITRLAIAGTGRVPWEPPTPIDPVHVAQSCAGLLPCLEELAFSGVEWDGARDLAARQTVLCSTLAALLPRLRRLAVPLPPAGGEVRGLGALAHPGCGALRSLALSVSRPEAGAHISDGMLADLCKLGQLEELSVFLGTECAVEAHYSSSSERRRLVALLSSHRPPNVRTITLTTGAWGALTLVLSYAAAAAGARARDWARDRAAGGAGASAGAAAPAAGAPSSGTGGGGQVVDLGSGPIRRVAFYIGAYEPRWFERATLWARVVLAAAQELQQCSIPELYLHCLGTIAGPRLRVSFPQSADPLPLLLARSRRVEAGWLALDSTLRTPPGRVTAMLRRLRLLPDEIELHHGTWRNVGAPPAVAAAARQMRRKAAAAAAGGGGGVAVAAPAPFPHVGAETGEKRTGGKGAQQHSSTKHSGARESGGGKAGSGKFGSSKRRSEREPEGPPRPPKQRAALRLHLDTATPEQVMREALDRLWAMAGADRHAPSAARQPLAGAAGGSCSGGGGSGGGGGGSGGSIEDPRGTCLVLLQGAMPPVPDDHDAYEAWDAWGERALRALLGVPPAGPPRSQPLPPPSPPLRRRSNGPSGQLAAAQQAATAAQRQAAHQRADYRRLLLTMRGPLAVPAAGLLLVECRSPADAAALVEHVSQRSAAAAARTTATGGAAARGGGGSSGSGSGGGGSGGAAGSVRTVGGCTTASLVLAGSRCAPSGGEGLFSDIVLEVLMEVWAGSAPPAAAAAGRGDSGGGAAAAATPAAAAALRQAVLSTTGPAPIAAAVGEASRGRPQPALVPTEEFLGRLEQLLALDAGVRALWQGFEYPEHWWDGGAEAHDDASGSDSDGDSDGDSDSDGDGDSDDDEYSSDDHEGEDDDANGDGGEEAEEEEQGGYCGWPSKLAYKLATGRFIAI
ncbi:hypothetical protein HYH02_010674 [Chlamydomonas schloesseri]|uniref:Uncharacterized protein n=1 Tax=Chlamydomonas schloesseri TaxID=2026947 RepID=A0A835TIB0_9CHLO|nr:hypothetical protein HYH02_010674 [Chlamydomonas schloesseri]|eukprot:KAG2438876.1 hypothetical protein HYH02_010674 [Chlamydomonas schloesseri]